MKNNLLFYPICNFRGERHAFDNAKFDDIINSLRNEKDIKIIHSEGDVEYKADLLNDWDDTAEDWLVKECSNIIKETDIDEKFVKGHWCIAVPDDVVYCLNVKNLHTSKQFSIFAALN